MPPEYNFPFPVDDYEVMDTFWPISRPFALVADHFHPPHFNSSRIRHPSDITQMVFPAYIQLRRAFDVWQVRK